MPATSARYAVQRSLLTDALVLIGLAGVLTLAFANSSIDLAAARLFYSARTPDHWPLATRMPWLALYRASTWITASLVLLGLGGFAMSVLRHRSAWRRNAIFILLSVVIGPGLIINVVCKDHWDRPRPRDIIEFGGPLHYSMAPLRGEAGASFPCGHCSVGFLYALGFALGVAHLLYHHVLRIPAEEAVCGGCGSKASEIAVATVLPWGAPKSPSSTVAPPSSASVATASCRVRLVGTAADPAVQAFELDASAANVAITVVDTPARAVGISGELHGFGLPTSQLSTRIAFSARPLPTLVYRVVQRGWFTDLSGNLVVRLPLDDFRHLIVRLRRGNIRVTDATQAAATRTGRLTLDLKTDAGIVQRQR